MPSALADYQLDKKIRNSMRELIQRGIFGIVFLLFVFAPFVLDLKNSTNLFNLTLYVFVMLSTYELFKMGKGTAFPSNLMLPAMLFNTALFLPMLIVTIKGLFPELPLNSILMAPENGDLVFKLVIIGTILVVLSLIIFTSLIFVKGSVEAIYKFVFPLNILYIAVPFALLSVAYTLSPKEYKQLLLLALLPIYLNDTFAYLSGRLFGKRLMFPRVSPKKTWEGFIGGMLIAAIVMATLLYFNRTELTTNKDYLLIAIVSCLVSILATLGDLFESKLKRTANVKDSGGILPGHGGILDRIDAMLFAAPIMFVILILA